MSNIRPSVLYKKYDFFLKKVTHKVCFIYNKNKSINKKKLNKIDG